MRPAPIEIVEDYYVTEDGGITDRGIDLVQLAFSVLQKASYRNSVAHGWYDDADGNLQPPQARNFGEITALFHSEITEMFDEWRNGEPFDEITYSYKHLGGARMDQPSTSVEGTVIEGKPEGVAAEMADTFIRMFDTAEALGIPLARALVEKHAYNFSRPYRHGNKRA